jgi:hypothetical protein
MLDPIKATVPLKTRFLQYNSTTDKYFQTTMVCIDLLHPWDDGMTIPSRPGYILVYTCDAGILGLLFNS